MQNQPDLRALRAKLREFSATDLSNRTLKLIFEKIIYYLPNEISQADAMQYHINDEHFAKLQAEGGLVFKIAD